jgi:hypothetical protein
MADHAASLDAALYWVGYRWGVGRCHLGGNFGTSHQHAWRLALAENDDPLARNVGRGYRDGLKRNSHRLSICY